jgi:hypothetical protein
MGRYCWDPLVAAEEDQAKDPLPFSALITAYCPISNDDESVSKILEEHQRNDCNPKSNLRLVSTFVDQLSRAHNLNDVGFAKPTTI